MGFLFGGNDNQAQGRQPTVASGIRIQTSVAGKPIPILWGTNRIPGNLMWMGDFIATSTHQSGGGKSGGKGGGTGGKGSGGGGQVQITYSASVMFGLCEGPIVRVGQVWANRTIFASPAAAGSYSTLTGSYSQAPWTYLTTNHPTQALNYRGVAIVAAASLQLSATPVLPQYSWEIYGQFQYGIIAGSGKAFTIQGKVFTASPGSEVFTSVAHGFVTGQVAFVSSTGTLPAPLTAGSAVFIYPADADTFRLGIYLYDYGEIVVIEAQTAGTGVQSIVATPTTFTSVAHGFSEGQPVQASTTGTLPGGIAALTTYYAVNVTTDTFQLATQQLAFGQPTSVNANGKVSGAETTGSTAPFITATSLGTGVQTVTPVIIDAHPVDIVTDLLTNENYGAGFTAGQVGDMTTGNGSYQNFCTANGIFLSPVLDTQQAASEVLARIAMLTIAEVLESEGKVKLVPRGDVAITGNGVTYTPNLTPEYDLDDDDFYVSKGEPPISRTRSDPADAYNSLSLEVLDRGNQYAAATPEWRDQGGADLYGLRPYPSVLVAHEICSPALGTKIAQLLGQRQLYVRNTYKFRLPMTYCLLEAMDLVTISDDDMGLDRQLVRITDITDGSDTDGILEVIAEEVPVGVSSPARYGYDSFDGVNLNYNAQPGSINVPVIMDAPGALTTSGFELWVAAAGLGDDWGGSQIWASSDGDTFAHVGDMYGASRYGFLTANFSAGSSPDITNNCAVDLTASLGELLSGTQTDADDLNTLALVGSELFSYETATLNSPYNYTLGTYLIRGALNTPVAAHVTGDALVRLDSGIFHYAYPPEWVGKTIYLKFPSFNRWGLATESLAAVPAYTHTIGEPLGSPDDVEGFIAAQNGLAVVFSWILLEAPNVAGYEIRYGPLYEADGETVNENTTWESSIALTSVTRGTSVTSIKIPPGNWQCFIKARDLSRKYSINAASVAVEVTTQYVTLIDIDGAPEWFMRDYGVRLYGVDHAPTIDGTQAILDSVANGWSVFMWVTPETLPSAGNYATAIGKYRSDAANTGFAMQLNSNGSLVAYASDGANVVHAALGNSTVSTGKPFHLGMTFAQGGLAIGYIDGVAVGNVSIAAIGNMSNMSANVSIGGETAPAPAASLTILNAVIDEILFYPSVLDAETVAQIYEGEEVAISFNYFVSSNWSQTDYARIYFSCDLVSGVSPPAINSESVPPGVVGGWSLQWQVGQAELVPSTRSSKLVRHCSGVLIPEDKRVADDYGWELFDETVINPFSLCRQPMQTKFGLPGYVMASQADLGINDSVRVWGVISSDPLVGYDFAAATKMQARPWSTAAGGFGNLGIDYAFQDWDIGEIVCRYSMWRALVYPNIAPVALSGFRMVIDNEKYTEQAQSVTVGPTGTAITFGPYHSAAGTPNLQVSVAGSSALVPTFSGLTSSGATLHVFNSAGTEVGGTVNWIVEGA